MTASVLFWVLQAVILLPMPWIVTSHVAFRQLDRHLRGRGPKPSPWVYKGPYGVAPLRAFTYWVHRFF